MSDAPLCYYYLENFVGILNYTAVVCYVKHNEENYGTEFVFLAITQH